MTQYCQIQKEHSFDLLDLSIVYYLPGMTFQSSLFSRTLLYCLPYVFFMYGLLLCLSLWYIRFVHGTVINLLLLSYYYCYYYYIVLLLLSVLHNLFFKFYAWTMNGSDRSQIHIFNPGLFPDFIFILTLNSGHIHLEVPQLSETHQFPFFFLSFFQFLSNPTW